MTEARTMAVLAAKVKKVAKRMVRKGSEKSWYVLRLEIRGFGSNG
jgi:hypothetical protein